MSERPSSVRTRGPARWPAVDRHIGAGNDSNGARHIDSGQRPDEPHVVLADPGGNELCVIEPENSFLAGCQRPGAVNCDGSREVGYFWSNALGWPLVWDQDDETAIRAPDGTGATPDEASHGRDGTVPMFDPDGNEFCLLHPRSS